MMEYYGSVVIAILVAVVVLLVLGQIPSRMGDLLAGAIEFPLTSKAGEAYRDFMDVSVPGVIVKEPYGCVVNRMIPLESFLTLDGSGASDVSETMAIQMEILSVRKENLEPANVQISTAKDALWFYSSGIYYLELRITVVNGRSRTQVVKLIVNEEDFL